MQFLKITDDMSLLKLSQAVGSRNVEPILSANGLSRTTNIGKQLNDMCNQANDITTSYGKANAGLSTPERAQKMSSILSTFSGDFDIFEYASFLNDAAWNVVFSFGTFPGMLRIPEVVRLPDSYNLLGNRQPVPKVVYSKVLEKLLNGVTMIDAAIFNIYGSAKTSIGAAMKDSPYSSSSSSSSSSSFGQGLFQAFHLPWGKISLYSSIDGTLMDFPVYPEELENSVKANYTTMPDMLYQYEPWQLYQSSGPRSPSYTFNMHRDMWTGDHRDGKCFELVQFCKANCYPEFRGSVVNTAMSTLYIAGKPHIRGVITDASERWYGPIGLDGWYLGCELSISFIEVSAEALNYSTVKKKSPIG